MFGQGPRFNLRLAVSSSAVRLLAPILALVLSLPLLLLGISWGLPSHAPDSFLFASHPVWTGQQILDLIGPSPFSEPGTGQAALGSSSAPSTQHSALPPSSGSDIDLNPITDRTVPTPLTDTDAARARVVLRYRLYTSQPDEMINLRAFAQMKPRELKFDPRLYQYGGVWFYPAGVALKFASLTGFVTLRPDLAFYLDHPESLARLYLVLRLVSTGWALLAVLAIYVLSRQLGANKVMCTLTAVCFATMPGVVVFAHEAKPHIAALSLALWAAAAGVQYLRRGTVLWLVVCTVLAAGSFGALVLYAFAGLIPLSALVARYYLVRPIVADGGNTRRFTLVSRVPLVLLGFLAVYALTNPYVLVHLLSNRPLLFGQLGNSASMYSHGNDLVAGFQTGFVLLVSLSPTVLLVFPALGLMLKDKRAPAHAYILAAPVVAMLITFVALAGVNGGKPGEFARFGLLIASTGVLGVAYLSPRFTRPLALPIAALLFHLLMSIPEILSYISDAGPNASRLTTAQIIASVDTPAIGVYAEPAPYNMPPVDLWKTNLVLLPHSAAPEFQGIVLHQPPLSDGFWRMSWADRAWNWEKLDNKGAPPR